MITIEKVLRFVSASTLAATVIFTIVVIIQELTKPKDVLERIKQEHCASVAELDETWPSTAVHHGRAAMRHGCLT